MSPKNIDLELLLVFDAVMAERHVTRAAERLGMSQSSVSRGLAQLRTLLGDALFLRHGRGVVPTHKAMELAAPVRQAISLLSGIVYTPDDFDPRTARLHFGIGATDYVSYVLLPALMQRLGEIAPMVSVEVFPIEPAVPEELLLTGKVDLVLSSVGAVSYPIYRQELFTDDYVCMRRLSHPLGDGALSIEQFTSCRHLAMPRQNGARERTLQDVMQRMGISRDVALQVPHMLAIPVTLAATDLIATVARRVAFEFAARYPLHSSPHPLPLGEFSVSQIWHERTRKSLSQCWLRHVIAEVARPNPEAQNPRIAAPVFSQIP